MAEPFYSNQRLDHLGIVAGICNKIGLIDQVNSFLPESERLVGVGEVVQAMVLNALGFVSRALYLTPEFFRNKPLHLLIRPGIEPELLNDDSQGRALDLIFEKGVTEIFTKVAAHALKIFNIDFQFVHLDSTTLSFEGDYNREEKQEDEITITFGHSKDKRPDLKQAVLSMICAYRSIIPVWMEALSGNEIDQNTFTITIKDFCCQLEGNAPFFVVDSAVYSKDNLQIIKDYRWITKVPRSLKEVRDLDRLTVEKEGWENTEDKHIRYRIHESDYGGVQQRWIVVLSEKRRSRMQSGFFGRLEKKTEQAKKSFRQLCQTQYSCKEDAEKAVAKLAKIFPLHNVEYSIERRSIYSKKGRPGKQSEPEKTNYQLKGKVLVNRQAVEEELAKIGLMVLATNELDNDKLGAIEAINLYKSQGQSVERGFRFLKDPMFFAHSLFLRKPSRLMSLMMIMTFSMLFQACLKSNPRVTRY